MFQRMWIKYGPFIELFSYPIVFLISRIWIPKEQDNFIILHPMNRPNACTLALTKPNTFALDKNWVFDFFWVHKETLNQRCR